MGHQQAEILALGFASRWNGSPQTNLMGSRHARCLDVVTHPQHYHVAHRTAYRPRAFAKKGVRYIQARVGVTHLTAIQTSGTLPGAQPTLGIRYQRSVQIHAESQVVRRAGDLARL